MVTFSASGQPLRPWRLCGRYSEIWLRLCCAYRLVPVVPEGSLVVALQIFRNKLILDPENFFGGEERIVRARHHTPLIGLRLLFSLFEDHRPALLEFV